MYIKFFRGLQLTHKCDCILYSKDSGIGTK